MAVGKGANMAGANREGRNAVEWEIRMGNWYVGTCTVGTGSRQSERERERRGKRAISVTYVKRILNVYPAG